MGLICKYLCCCCVSKKAESNVTKSKSNIKKSTDSSSVLSRAKDKITTDTGKPITRAIVKQIISKKKQQEVVSKLPFEGRQALSEPYIQFSKICDHLYLTGLGGLTQEDILEKNIKCIVNVTYDMPIYDCYGIQSIRIPVEDIPGEDIGQYFDEISILMNRYIKTNRNIVVHCVAGVSRSATIVIAYLMKEQRMSLKKAYRQVWKVRQFIRPNSGFVEQLIEYEKHLFGKTSVKMIEKQGHKIPDILIQLPVMTVTTTTTTESTGDSTVDLDASKSFTEFDYISMS